MPRGRHTSRRALLSTAAGNATAPPTANLWAWFKASSLASGDGDSVASWADSSGNGRNATQAVAINQPTYKVAIVNGKPIVRFDGSDALEIAALIGDSSTADMSLFAVANCNASSNRTLLANRPFSGNTGWQWRYTATTTLSYLHTGQTPGITQTVVDQFNLVEVLRDGLSIQLGVNGTLTSAAVQSGYTVTTLANTLIGSRGTLADPFTGDIAEILLYNATLAGADLAQLRSYINGQYRLW